jgi:hypothetical protein
MIIG